MPSAAWPACWPGGRCLSDDHRRRSAAFAATAPQRPAATIPPPPPPPGWNKHPPLPGPAHVHALVTSGMPGWQITLIAAGATVLAAAVVTLLARARAARRATASAA